jgi:glycosyltransferase involved in cell wall biosynthesis
VKAQKISVVVPAHNEEGNISFVVEELRALRGKTKWDMEIVLVNDNSSDNTTQMINELAKKYSFVKSVHRTRGDNGFGAAVIDGTKKASGDIIVWVMGDRSDNPKDIIGLINEINKGYDLVCGSRFMKKGSVHDYPRAKLVPNRIFNNVLRLIFGFKGKDLTNAFKAFRRDMLNRIEPLSCRDFDITIELPLKARLGGFKIGEAPVSWHGRVYGVSNLKLSRTAKKYIGTSIRIWTKYVTRRFGKGLI